MKITSHRLVRVALVLGSGVVACSDDAGTTLGTSTGTDTTGGSDPSSGGNPTTTPDPDTSSSSGTPSSTGPDPDTSGTPTESSSSGDEPVGPPAEFFVRVENLSGSSVLPTTFSPGMWLEQTTGSTPLFTIDAVDAGDGLVALAEDGDPAPLAAGLDGAADVVQTGTWADPLAPGEMIEFTFTAQNGNRLSLATGIGGANDGFVATGPVGIGLFTSQGQPEAERDITQFLRLYEVGSEANEAPGQGAQQLATQSAAGVGMDESGHVQPFVASTRALPQAAAILDVQSTTDMKTGEITLTITNTGDLGRGTVFSPLSPMVWALHEETASLFAADAQGADVVGLEALAEDGDPSEWFTAIDGSAGIGTAATIDTAAAPGEAFTIVVTPDQDNRFLSFATSITASNDAFIAPWPGGVALLEADGSARSNTEIEDDFRRMLVVWDAGTEANEVPGAGANIQSEQILPDSGASDPDPAIRPYSDATNDLAGADLGGFATVTIVNGTNPGEFDVTIENTSGGTVFPGALSRVLYAVHDDSVTLFEDGMPASPSLEVLAEDADASALFGDVDGAPGVSDAAISPSPLGPGATYEFTVIADDTTPRLSLAAMVIPSNDTFVALGGAGIALLDDAGDPLSDEALADAVAAALGAWESGTEANQAGAIGRDQAPRQADDGAGVAEGSGLVRFADDDLVWVWPEADQVIRVTVGPTGK